VDGFTSIGAPTIVRGIKKTLISQPPVAIFADIETLRAAPRPLLAAGFGDMMGKFTSAADFELGHLLWDEPFDADIAQRTRASAQLCVDHVAEIAAATETGMRTLFDALVESGYCMLDFGESRPASGAEHHMSHFIEMKLLQNERSPILHGAKVGVATIRAAQLYDGIKRLSQQEAAALIRQIELPDSQSVENEIRSAYGTLAEELIQNQAPFIHMSDEQFQQCQQRIIGAWWQIQAIAEKVPTATEFIQWIGQVGGPTNHDGLGITTTDFEKAYKNGHYLRQRFTVRKLVQLEKHMFSTSTIFYL